MRNCELLSPAGSMDALRAAVQNGADAVYFGAGNFNARRNAENFGETLTSAVHYCHIRGVKTFITLNTMVREDEFTDLTKTVAEIADSSADGVIVQDIGVASAVHEMAPSIELHASTQMAVHNAAGVEFLMNKGFRRVVLAREMTLSEIRECACVGPEIEVFVHGALCVSCSGQCLLSSMIGGRSGNRGLCAQPCRMLYQADGRSGYMLSTRDLCALEEVPALLEAGVYSFKLEGRLKRPEYVGLTTRIYHEALASVAKGKPFDAASRAEELRQMFNRGGFTRGCFGGEKESELMFSERPNHCGVEIGHCEKNGIVITEKDIDGRDTLLLRGNGRDISVTPGTQLRGIAHIPEAHRGDSLIRLVSECQMSAERAIVERDPLRIPCKADLSLKIGKPAVLELSDGSHTVKVIGDTVQSARSGHTDEERLKAQLEKTGDTAYTFTETVVTSYAPAFLPVSAVNAIRREACATLDIFRSGNPHVCGAYMPHKTRSCDPRKPEIIAQSSVPGILARASAAGASAVAWRPDDLRNTAMAAALTQLPEHFDLVLPPVMTQRTLMGVHAWAAAAASRIDRTWISNIGQLNLSWPGELWGDAHLNIANNEAAAQLENWGFTGYTPSIELTCAQIRPLSGKRSLIVYGDLPLMELRHCPYRNVHAMRGPHASCRHCDSTEPGEKISDMPLTDRTGAAFPLRRIASDDGCVIELLNSSKLMMLRKWSSLPDCSSVRILLDNSDPVEDILTLHRAAVEGQNIRTLEAFTAIEQINTTTGHYFRGVL